MGVKELADLDDANSANLIEKFSDKIQFLISSPVNKKSGNIILCGLKNLLRLMNFKYDTAKHLSIKWMEAILKILEKCDNAKTKADFEEIIPSLTSSCAAIVGHSNALPSFQSKFFALWKDILEKTSVERRRQAFSENRSITQIFEAIFGIGHFLTQVNGLKVLFLYIMTITSDNDRKVILNKIMGSQKCRSMRRIIAAFNYQNFDIVARQFLNEFNMSVSEEQPVCSIKVKAGYIGTTPIKNPQYQGKDMSLWADFNSATASISFYCAETTFPEGSSENWVNVEAYIKNILIDRSTQEFRVYSKKAIEVNPPSDYKIFNRYKHEFRFSYYGADTEKILPIVSFYNSGGNKNIDNITNKYSGYKTLIHAETGMSKQPQKPIRIPNPSSDDDIDKCSKVSTNLSVTTKSTFKKHLAPHLILEKSSDIVSSKASKYPLESEEIEETCTEFSDKNSTFKAQPNPEFKRKQILPTKAILSTTEKSCPDKQTADNTSLNLSPIKNAASSDNKIENEKNSILSTQDSESISQVLEYINSNLNMDTNKNDSFDFLKHTVENNEKNDEVKITTSTSKRKLYSVNQEFPCSQISKDSQIQRRKYIKEKRKYSTKDQLKLVNLLDPFEISDKSEQVLEISSSTNDKIIAGDNEEIIRKNMEEYSKNHGYVGIKNALRDETKVSHITPKQREIINSNIEKINAACERSAKRFFKNGNRDLSKSHIYEMPNVVAANSKRPRGRPTKTPKPVVQKPVVPIFREKDNPAALPIVQRQTPEVNTNVKQTVYAMQSDCNEITYPSFSLAHDMDTPTAKGYEEHEQEPITTSSPRPVMLHSETHSKDQNTDPNIGKEQSKDDNNPCINISSMEEESININNPFNKTDSDTAKRGRNVIVDEQNHETSKTFAQSILSAANVRRIERAKAAFSESSASVSVRKSSTIAHKKIPSEVILPRLQVVEVEPNNSNVGRGQLKSTNDHSRRPAKKNDMKTTTAKHSANSTEAVAVSDDDDCSSTASSWILQKYFSNISKTSPERTQGNVTAIEACRAQLLEHKLEEIKSLSSQLNFELLEDDNVDLESYGSESTNCPVRLDESTSESENDSAIYNVSKTLKTPQFCDKKRKSTERGGEIVPLKKFKDSNDDQTVEDELLSSFESIANEIIARITESLKEKGSNQHILELIQNIFKSYFEPYMYHAKNSKRSFNKLKKIRNTLIKEKTNFLVESTSANKQLRKLCAALGTVEKSCKEKEVNMNQAYETAVAAINTQLEHAMKTHWEKYIEKVTKAYIGVIKQHSVIDTSYED